MKARRLLLTILLFALAAPAAHALDNFRQGCYVISGKWQRSGDTDLLLVYPGSKMEERLEVEDLEVSRQAYHTGDELRLYVEVTVPGRGSNARIRIIRELDPVLEGPSHKPVQYQGPAPCSLHKVSNHEVDDEAHHKRQDRLGGHGEAHLEGHGVDRPKEAGKMY